MMYRLVTGLIQTMSGSVLLLDSIILNLQSTDVIQLILDLTALFFIQEADNLAFQLAHVGVLSMGIQKHCEMVKNYKRVFPKEVVERKIFGTRVLTISLSLMLLVPFSVVLTWQMRGRFLCKHGMFPRHLFSIQSMPNAHPSALVESLCPIW
jgi:hypothetical protein